MRFIIKTPTPLNITWLQECQMKKRLTMNEINVALGTTYLYILVKHKPSMTNPCILNVKD